MSSILVTCDWCKKEFAPTPDNFTEGGVDMMTPPDDGEAWKGTQPKTFDPAEMTDGLDDELKAFLKKEFDLTDEESATLFATGHVDTHTCVCDECMDEAEEVPE